jgi:5'-3' exonuclease
MTQNIIFIDGSYFCFYRFYALNNWWKNAYPDESLDEPINNEKFVDKFKKTFIEVLQKIPKNLNIDKSIEPILFVGKDCTRENIWRNTLFPDYKANRLHNEAFKGGPFFKMAYYEKLFIKGGVKAILSHPKLEADDCIAISVKYLAQKYPKCMIYIVTSDGDYLQLKSENILLYNLAYKNISENKSSTGDAKLDLWIKTMAGDKSDNIPSVFPKCGPKTAIQCYNDKEYFLKKMEKDPEYYKQFELNEKLVNFERIPQELIDEFYANIGI